MNRLKNAVKFVMVILILGAILYNVPFNRKIEKTVSAVIYEDGKAVGETAVYIKGEKSNYVFKNREYFSGTFYVECYEESGREDVSAEIAFYDDYGVLSYMQNGIFPDMEIENFIYINEEMTDFAFKFKDGRIGATSEDMYEKMTGERL